MASTGVVEDWVTRKGVRGDSSNPPWDCKDQVFMTYTFSVYAKTCPAHSAVFHNSVHLSLFVTRFRSSRSTDSQAWSNLINTLIAVGHLTIHLLFLQFTVSFSVTVAARCGGRLRARYWLVGDVGSQLKPISQLRFDYDTTTTRLRRKIDMLIFCSRQIAANGSRRARQVVVGS